MSCSMQWWKETGESVTMTNTYEACLVEELAQRLYWALMASLNPAAIAITLHEYIDSDRAQTANTNDRFQELSS